MACNISHLPRGFQFNPTDEHLIEYLREKIENIKLELDLKVVDINTVEPWNLPDLCKLATDVEQKEWYFFTRLVKKSTGSSNVNRTTKEGHWKSSGTEKPVHSESDPTKVIGMKRALVFHKRTGADEQITDWVINEYRSALPKGDGLVLCKLYKKLTAKRKWNDSPSKENIAGSSISLAQQLEHGQTQNLPQIYGSNDLATMEQSDDQDAATKEADSWLKFGSPTNSE